MNRKELVNRYFCLDQYGMAPGQFRQERVETICKALLACVNGDGDISEAERNYIIGQAAARGASDEVLDRLQRFDGKQDVAEILQGDAGASKTGRRVVVYQAIKACAVDEYNAKERAMVRRMAKLLEVPENAVAEIEAFVQEENALRDKRAALLFPEGKPR